MVYRDWIVQSPVDRPSQSAQLLWTMGFDCLESPDPISVNELVLRVVIVYHKPNTLEAILVHCELADVVLNSRAAWNVHHKLYTDGALSHYEVADVLWGCWAEWIVHHKLYTQCPGVQFSQLELTDVALDQIALRTVDYNLYTDEASPQYEANDVVVVSGAA